MKRVVPGLMLVMLIFSNSYSQNVEIYGYFEPQAMGAYINSDFLQLFSNKLRVDFKSEVNEKISFGGNFDYITYHGKKEWNILDYLPVRITEGIPENHKPYYSLNYDNKNFLDNAWIKLSLKKADITIGKQQLSFGTGYTWNPTDIYNIKNIIDPTYEQPGCNAVRFDIPIGLSNNLTFVYSPEENWRHSTKLINFKTNISRFDISFSAAERDWLLTDYINFTQHYINRKVIGGDFSGEVLGLGVWGEFAFNFMLRRNDYYEIVFGADYTFGSGVYLMGEYFRNSLGITDYEDYDINDWIRQLSGEIKSISRDQFITYISYPATDLITLGNSIIYSLSDNSLALVPIITYSAFENAEITGIGSIYLGKSGAAYSGDLGNGGIFRIRYYF